MARTLSDEDIEAIAQRVAAILARPAQTRPAGGKAIEPDAIYTADEAAALVGLHPFTVRKKFRCGLIAGRRKLGRWRIRGAELLKFA